MYNQRSTVGSEKADDCNEATTRHEPRRESTGSPTTAARVEPTTTTDERIPACCSV